MDTIEIVARSPPDRPEIPVHEARADGRLWGARRTKQLVAQWTARLGPEAVDTVLADRLRRAAELVAIAERTRVEAMKACDVTLLDNLVRLENCAELAVKRLDLDRPRKPEGPSLATFLASRKEGAT
jgi:hypothetical protein